MADKALARIEDEVKRDLAPVRPLRPAWLDALAVLPLAVLLLVWLVLQYGLRTDASSLGLGLFGPSAILIGAAYAIVVLSLVQRAPESTLSWVFWLLVPLAAASLQIAGGLVTLSASGPDPEGIPWQAQALCFVRISLMSAPPVVFLLWLLSHGLPLRPRIAGLFAGLGSGILADAIYRLFCSLSGPRHTTPWHAGAVLAMGLLGLVCGLSWERLRLRRFVERRA
jgi:hypothetical protein